MLLVFCDVFQVLRWHFFWSLQDTQSFSILSDEYFSYALRLIPFSSSTCYTLVCMSGLVAVDVIISTLGASAFSLHPVSSTDCIH